MTEIHGLHAYEPAYTSLTVRVYDQHGNDIDARQRHCTEPDCRRPIVSGFMCKLCAQRLQQTFRIFQLEQAVRGLTAPMLPAIDGNEVYMHVSAISDDPHVALLFENTAEACRAALELLNDGDAIMNKQIYCVLHGRIKEFSHNIELHGATLGVYVCTADRCESLPDFGKPDGRQYDDDDDGHVAELVAA